MIVTALPENSALHEAKHFGESGQEPKTSTGSRIRCPYRSQDGRRCLGHVVRVELCKAEVSWRRHRDENWKFVIHAPYSTYRVYCSEKGNHGGYTRPDSEKLKFYFEELPAALRVVIEESLLSGSTEIIR